MYHESKELYPDDTWVDDSCNIRNPEQIERMINEDFTDDDADENEENGRIEIELSDATNDIVLHVRIILNLTPF